MTVAPHSGIVDFGTFTSPVGGVDGIQGEVPAPLSGQDNYVLSALGWVRTGETQYFYIKASAAISIGQVVMFTGSVGSSGVLTGAPATGVTEGKYIMGVAAQNMAHNDFGLVTSFGPVRGFDTTGSSVGETWADGDILYYNPSYVGGLTKVEPNPPNVKVLLAAVINAGGGGSGSIFVRITDYPSLNDIQNVLISSPANNDVLTYNSSLGYWVNAVSTGGDGVTRGQIEQQRLGAFT